MRTLKQHQNQKALTIIVLLSFCCVLSYGQTSIMALYQNIYSPDGSMGTNQHELFNGEILVLNTTNTITETADRIASNSFSLLAVEFEQEQEIEEWMLDAFAPPVAQRQLNTLIKQDSEQELEIEDWMVNLNTW